MTTQHLTLASAPARHPGLVWVFRTDGPMRYEPFSVDAGRA